MVARFYFPFFITENEVDGHAFLLLEEKELE